MPVTVRQVEAVALHGPACLGGGNMRPAPPQRVFDTCGTSLQPADNRGPLPSSCEFVRTAGVKWLFMFGVLKYSVNCTSGVIAPVG